MRSIDPQDEAAISISYLHLLLGWLADGGVTQRAALDGSLISPAVLLNPDARISPRQIGRVFLNGVRATGEEALAYEVGLRMKPSSHGFLGFAALTSPSMEDALEAVLRYCSARQHVLDLAVRSEGTHAFIELTLRREVGGRPEPAYHCRYRERLPVSRFDQPVTGVRFPTSMLALRPMLSDECAFLQAVKPCEQELAKFGPASPSPVQRVRQLLVLDAGAGYPSMGEIAERLHMSPRNLSRQLQREGASYLALLDDARQRDAKALLLGAGSVQDIAAQLGYLNPANFTRAFRKWTDESPTGYRMRHAGSDA